jgi:hypothetical protein
MDDIKSRVPCKAQNLLGIEHDRAQPPKPLKARGNAVNRKTGLLQARVTADAIALRACQEHFKMNPGFPSQGLSQVKADPLYPARHSTAVQGKELSQHGGP